MIIRKLRGKQQLLAIALAAGVAVSAVAGSAVIKSGKTEAQAATTDTSTSQTPPALPDGSWQYTTVTSEDTLSKTLTGLKSGKTYQVKVRAYEKVNGEKVYGSYSAIRKVKCK